VIGALVVDKQKAWNEFEKAKGFGSGGSRTNSLYWAASRAPPTPSYNASTHPVDLKDSIKKECNQNSACDAIGMF
jgi:hypothetical protein